MNEREKLANIIIQTPCVAVSSKTAAYHIADHLIANGVIVPPCKVGDTVFMIKDEKIYDGAVRYVRFENHKDRGSRSDISAYPNPYFAICSSFEDFGKTVFLTKEEAEQALKESEQGGR